MSLGKFRREVLFLKPPPLSLVVEKMGSDNHDRGWWCDICVCVTSGHGGSTVVVVATIEKHLFGKIKKKKK